MNQSNILFTIPTDPFPDVWIKVRYTIDGPTQSIKLRDFVRIEDDFLLKYAKFPDGFYGYYHKDAFRRSTRFIKLTPKAEALAIMPIHLQAGEKYNAAWFERGRIGAFYSHINNRRALFVD